MCIGGSRSRHERGEAMGVMQAQEEVCIDLDYSRFLVSRRLGRAWVWAWTWRWVRAWLWAGRNHSLQP